MFIPFRRSRTDGNFDRQRSDDIAEDVGSKGSLETSSESATSSERAPRLASRTSAPWMRSLSQPAAWKLQQQNQPSSNQYTQVSDHNWTYIYDSHTIGIPIKGFGNVPIASYENIAKMCDRRLQICCNVRTLDHLAKALKTMMEDETRGDLVTIALQEIPPSSKTFHEDSLKILGPALRTHSLYFSHRAWTQMVMIFIRRQHLRFAIDATSGQRVQDYQKISKALRFPTLKKFHGSEGLFSADVVLWTGDLNFRFNSDPAIDWQKDRCLSSELHDSLMEKDELQIFRSKGIAFKEFAEAPIRFPPTHKFIVESDEYVPKRIPSYTDRVLYWSRNTEWMQPSSYDSIRGPSPSDHRAVYCSFW
ncbi:unnamed protein product [Caenorhabditis auriculariae]|uniref:Inositol polyphosphate-related phosphatase domain-containing protein n=1 Tax=Caenorhabditis auriculariae TaxID=2777116 RepID=A0A8S1HQU5_9PELO|nr:unnamed protein product [Caenorhabditis auriculariae]